MLVAVSLFLLDPALDLILVLTLIFVLDLISNLVLGLVLCNNISSFSSSHIPSFDISTCPNTNPSQ